MKETPSAVYSYDMVSTGLSGYFSSAVRSRGESYYKTGQVTLRQGSDISVEAVVKGTKNYKVGAKIEKNTLRVDCTCPYFDGFVDPCKHIWATLITADKMGYLKAADSGISKLKLGAGGITLDEIGGIDDTDEYEDEDEAPAIASFKKPQGFHQPPTWKEQLGLISHSMSVAGSYEHWPPQRQIIYIMDVSQTLYNGNLTLEIAWRKQMKYGGEWTRIKSTTPKREQIATLPNQADREILSLLMGASNEYLYYRGGSIPHSYHLDATLYNILIPQICKTDRFYLRKDRFDDNSLQNIIWDDKEPWEFCLKIERDKADKNYLIQGSLARKDERMDLAEPTMLLAGGLVFARGYAARLNDFNAFEWIATLRRYKTISVPIIQEQVLLEKLYQLPHQPKLEIPPELRCDQIKVTPRPRLIIRKPKEQWYNNEYLFGDLSFDYDGHITKEEDAQGAIFIPQSHKIILRDKVFESDARETIKDAGFMSIYDYGSSRRRWRTSAKRLPKATSQLLEKKWYVEAEGKLYRQPGDFNFNVSTGIDWFELRGKVKFGDQEAELPQILTALKHKENMVRLGDGSFGILPEDWLKKYGVLTGIGKIHQDHLRYSKTQLCLLDAMLATQPSATCDGQFKKARQQLAEFEGIKPLDPPKSFVGKLRHYQRDGLGWLLFLKQFGFGGCLADDMGLGKTIQVLALLEAKRNKTSPANNKAPRVSLVVVPRSLVFNWIDEAKRFTPELKVLNYSGIDRLKANKYFNDYDLVVTTYGVIRRDIIHIKEILFDYCILDESQAIKNDKTASAKASRLLQCNHRLALSGTPIENHLGELWSLFEFLNPGMLGTADIFKANSSDLYAPDEDSRKILARGLRPFILRRTKQQVAKDLPPKTDTTIYCELEGDQKKQYDEVLSYYRSSLLERVKREGINRLKIHVLETLLRLRQVACHPGLIDKAKIHQPSAKLDSLLPHISEVIEEGHKALVFSQFTSFLAIVRDRLDREKTPYEYLNGQTHNRAKCVERFQNDPTCPLFLISLKAGGLGLNLTAAEYVFILDPWWNPAVEMQAIDRTHRIGQTKPVFAYRLIARNTVEEKVLALQQTKRDSADAIINADNSFIRKLSREDLEMLLS